MKTGQTYSIFVSTVITALAISVSPSQAATLADSGTWSYTIDPSYDSLAFDGRRIVAGNTGFEIYGSAFKDEGTSLIFALTANLPITGKPSPTQVCTGGNCFPIPDGNVGWGDVLLDLSGSGNFKAASDSRSLIGIRFTGNTPGVFGGVQATSVVSQNFGWSNLNNHNTELKSLTNKEAGMGDLAWNDPYYADYNTTPGSYGNPSSQMPNVIGSYTSYLGGIQFLNDTDLQTAGFNTSAFPVLGSQTIAFRVDKSVFLPPSLATPVSFIASIMEECNNDGIALRGTITPRTESEKVPEPSVVLGLLTFGGLVGITRIHRRKVAV